MQRKDMRRTRLVLGPLDRVQIDTILNHLPKGTQLAQEVHAILDSLENVVDLGVGGESTNAEADTAVCALVAAAQSMQDVAGLEGGRSASTAGRQGNVLEGHQKRLALDVGERDVHTAGVVMLGVTIQSGVIHREQTLGKALGEALDVLGIVLKVKSKVSIFHVLKATLEQVHCKLDR